MPTSYVKPYVKRNKNDMADAEAICEAVTRPNMRFVAIKSAEQRSILVLHRARALLVRQRTMLANAIRAHLAEFGVVVAQGVSKLLEMVTAPTGTIEAKGPLPPLVAKALSPLIASLVDLGARIKTLENEIARQHRACEVSRRLESIPGFGVMTATAMAATVADPEAFQSGREFAAWLGLTPRQNSYGGKQRLGGITKMGDGCLRTLLVCGATAVIRFALEEGSAKTAWIRKLLEKKPAKVVAVALASKMARIAWAIMVKRDVYRPTPAPAVS